MEALKAIAPKGAWARYNNAVSAWRSAGSPTRFVFRSTWVDGDEAIAHNQAENAKRNLLRQKEMCWNLLWNAFRAELALGNYLAVGRPNSPNAEPVAIEPVSWRHMRPFDWERSVVVMAGNPPMRFYDLSISLAPERAAKKRFDSIMGAQTACEEWLVAQMLLPSSWKPKKNYKAEALQKFQGLSGRSFDTAWKAAGGRTHSNWSHAGRPGKSPQAKSKRQ